VKFSKNFNVCDSDHDTSTSLTDGRTDGQTTCDGNTASALYLFLASRGKNDMSIVVPRDPVKIV